MHLGDPVSEAVENEAAHNRIVGVQRISRTAVVRVLLAIRLKDVVHIIGQAAEA